MIEDRVRMPGRQVDPWMQRMELEYLPRAEQLGATVYVSHSHCGPRLTEVRVSTVVTTVGAFWRLRGAMAADVAVGRWWSWSDDTAARCRAVYIQDRCAA
ncbi:hypothetical protein [Streptomyces sp. SM12]|uniref:hypothetical protein n=1 Tax=Streptomyces sp. SM12 TaxID=1071602 RepID=UPI0011B06EF3|nr:hypothetical protein [Streptomyces sp. SM12]